MIDVILYGEDRRGRLIARERRFRSFRGLVHFFGSLESVRWRWAEVAQSAPDGRTIHVRYPAEDLRSMVVIRSPEPSLN